MSASRLRAFVFFQDIDAYGQRAAAVAYRTSWSLARSGGCCPSALRVLRNYMREHALRAVIHAKALSTTLNPPVS